MDQWIRVEAGDERLCISSTSSAQRSEFSKEAFVSWTGMPVLSDLGYNLNPDVGEWLKIAYYNALSSIDDEFLDSEGVIGLTKQPTYYAALPYRVSPSEIRGELLMISFWAYGDSSIECFCNLDRLFQNLWNVSRRVSDQIPNKS